MEIGKAFVTLANAFLLLDPNSVFLQNTFWRRTAMAGPEFFWSRLRVCGIIGALGESSRPAKTNKDNERKLICEKSK